MGLFDAESGDVYGRSARRACPAPIRAALCASKAADTSLALNRPSSAATAAVPANGSPSGPLCARARPHEAAADSMASAELRAEAALETAQASQGVIYSFARINR